MKFSIMIFSPTTLSIMAFGIETHRIFGLHVTSRPMTLNSNIQCLFTACHIFFIVMLNVEMLNVIMPNVITLNVIMLNII